MRLRKKQSLRIVSGALAVSMALSVFPTAAFAAGTPQKTEAENSAVETQVEESQDNLTTLEFDENGLPIGEGSAEEGWEWDGSNLTICEGYTFERPEQVVSCAVDNYGVILGGTFKEHVSAVSHGILAKGVFAEEPSSEQSFTSGTVTVPEGCKINGAISDKAYVVECPEIVITVPEGENAKFYNPEITYSQDYTSTWQHEVVDNTLRFKASGWNNIIVRKYQKFDLVIGEDGKPTSEGNEPSGWSYDGSSLTIYENSEFDFGTQTIKCYVNNYGTVENGIFAHGFFNSSTGLVEGSTFTSFHNEDGTYSTYGVSNSGKMINAVDASSNTYNQGDGLIDGGKFGYVDNCGLVQNVDIGSLYNGEGGKLENCVFGISSNGTAPDDARVLTLSANAIVNDIIKVEPNSWNENSNKVYVVGDRDVTVKYAGDSKYFDVWKSEPNVEMNKVDDVTYTFTVPEGGTTLTAKERVVQLTFDENGKPTEMGNKTSGWTYDGYTLKFYEGYTFNQDVIVKCFVENAGTITAGTFTQGVDNSVWDYQNQKNIYGTVTGGVFAGLDTKTAESANVHMLIATGSVINGVILNGAYIAGTDQKVTVTRNADDADFESWNLVSGNIDIADPASKTIEFTMPAENVVLSVNYKDNVLEFDANGNPTHAGGKNWERIYIGRDDQGVDTYGLILKDGAVLDTNGVVKCQIISYPGSTIKNGIFENDEDSGYQLMNLGTIENGTFNSTVINAGTILDGSFNKPIGNVNIKLDSSQDLSGLSQGIDLTVTECPGLIFGGTFSGEVVNFGVIEGGEFKETVSSVPLEAIIGNSLESQNIKFTNVSQISNGTFEAEVQNAANITGGEFKEKVTNVGTIENGAFRNTVLNTTMSNQEMSLGDSAVAVMSLLGSDADLAIEVQNDVKTAKVYTGSITGGVFKGKVDNTDGAITGGVFKNAPQNGNVENLHTLTVTGADISTSEPNYENGSQFTWASVHEKAYVAGKQEVRIFGVDGTHSWKSDDVDLSEASLANDGRVIAFAMPGDKDVTLTASTEKPEAKTYAVTVENGKATVEGNAIEKAKAGDTVTITANAAAEGKEFAGWKIVAGGVTLDDASKTTTTFTMGEEAVTVEATYKDKTTTKPTEPTKPSEDTTITVDKDTKLDEDKTYDKDVKNDGTISKGEFTGEVTNNGTIENGTFTDTVTNNGIIKNGKFSGEVKGTGKIEGGTFQQVTEASEISGGVFGAQSDMSNAKVVPSTLKIESSVAGGSLINDVIGNGAAQALALFAENDIATQAADSAEMVAYVVGNQTLTVKYTGTDKNFDKWDTTSLDGAKLSEDGKTITFTMKSGAGDVTLKSVRKKTDTKPTEPAKKDDDGMGELIVGGVIVAGGIATGVIVYNVAMDYIKSALPEGTAIPETREQLAAALWESAGKPEVAVEEGVVLTDTEKAMRWATENKLVSADGADSVSKFDVLVAVYKAKKL